MEYTPGNFKQSVTNAEIGYFKSHDYQIELA